MTEKALFASFGLPRQSSFTSLSSSNALLSANAHQEALQKLENHGCILQA